MRWQEGSPTEGCFQPACPRHLLAGVGTWPERAASLFVPGEHTEKLVVLQEAPVLASGAHFFQQVWSTAASSPVLTVPRQLR